jgi:hypothetical protein
VAGGISKGGKTAEEAVQVSLRSTDFKLLATSHDADTDWLLWGVDDSNVSTSLPGGCEKLGQLILSYLSSKSYITISIHFSHNFRSLRMYCTCRLDKSGLG